MTRKEEIREELEEILDALPVREELRFLISIEAGRMLKWVEIAEIEESLPLPLGTDAESKKAAERVFKLARQLDDTLLSMPLGAWSIIKSEIGETEPTTIGSRLLARARLGPAQPPIKSKGGRPVKSSTRRARYLATTAAGSYRMLTGKPATPGCDRVSGERNAFEGFLTEVFAVLGVGASSEVQAKALRAREKTKKK
jgi:hypothetical protein